MRLDPYPIRAVHLTAIWAYGVSQPVFSLVDANPDLVITRGASRLDVVAFVLPLTLLPPLVAVGYAWIAGRFSPWVGDVVYLVLLGVFLIPLALQVAKYFEPGVIAVVLLVSVLCATGVFLYVRLRLVRLFVGFSVVLPVIGLSWFVHGLPSLTGEAEAARAKVANPRPVVFVVLDELPLSSLMRRDGTIDEIRYPAFARLARDGVWYRNATTVHGGTLDAVPAMLTGRTLPGGARPVAAEHPENVFTLLAGSYSLRVHEAGTRLCPPTVCPPPHEPFVRRLGAFYSDVRDAYLTRVVPRSALPERRVVDLDISMERESTRTLEAYDALLDELRRTESDRALYFVHLYLPHAPWRFLPSGTQYPFRGIDGWMATEFWRDDAWPVLVGQQRHLLQVGYTDRVLGRLVDVLDRRGIFDRALIVLVADHGASFVPGGARRPVTEANVADIANVPMFVKYPGQSVQGVDDRGARTVDLLPTIADVLGIDLPWPVDGVSLLTHSAHRRSEVIVHGDGGVVVASLGGIERGREATVRRQSAAFGEGHDSLYRIGVHRGLLGARVDATWARSQTIRVQIDDRLLERVDTSSDVLPLRISGLVTKGSISPEVELAVAVNGRIVALTRPWREGGVQRFRALVPESTLRGGVNRVEVFAITGQGSRTTVIRV